MCEENGMEVIGDAASALKGVCDLCIFNWRPGHQDMHGVEAENLERLLDLIAREIERGRRILLGERA